MTVLLAMDTTVTPRLDGVEVLSTMTGGYVNILGTHVEIRALAYRIIEATDRIKAAEWKARVDAENAPSPFEVVGFGFVDVSDEISNYGDTSVEQANAYLRSVGIDPDSVAR